MAYLLQQLANAVPLAALYATLAFGYSIAFGVMKRADITYGALFAFAGQMDADAALRLLTGEKVPQPRNRRQGVRGAIASVTQG